MPIVSQREFADIVGRSESMIQKLVKAGLPVVQRGKPGRATRIDTAAAFEWMVIREVERKVKSAARYQSAEERQQHLDYWRMEKLRIETLKLEGKLIDREITQVAVNEAFVIIRTHTDAVAARLANRLAKISEAPHVRALLLEEYRSVHRTAAQELETHFVVDADQAPKKKRRARKKPTRPCTRKSRSRPKT